MAVTYSSSNTAVATVSGSTVTIIAAGSSVITASQAGNTNYLAAVNVQQTLTITLVKTTQSITFGPLTAKTFGDPSFGLTATATSGLPVNYTSSNTTVATVSGSTITIVGAGNSMITASQGGDASYFAAPDVQQALTINKASQTITFGTLAAKTFGDPAFGLTANASSGLAVTYSSSNTAVATVSGITVTILGAGTTVITASLSGNLNYLAATAVQQTLTVNEAAQTITFVALSARTFGNPSFSLTATASSGLAVTYSSSNTAVATVSGSTVNILGAGTSVITASQAGNTNYLVAPNVQQTLVVNQASQTITFGALPAKVVGDPAFALSATATSGLAITYASSNTAVATVSGNTVTIFSAGTSVITASQAGNTNYLAASNVQQTLTVTTVAKTNQTITFAALATKTFGNSSFTISATASSGLPVTFTSSNTSVAVVGGNTVTITGAGTSVITASQAGNATYAAASDVPQTLTVNRASQSISFSSLPIKVVGDAPITLTATASSGLPVSYSSSVPAIASVSGSTLTILSAGTTTITAMQAGNLNYLPAANVGRTFRVVNFTFVTSPSNGATNQSITLNVKAQPQSRATTYTIELSPTMNFSSGVLVKSGTKNTQTFNLTNNTTYYTRVKTDLSVNYGSSTSFTTVAASGARLASDVAVAEEDIFAPGPLLARNYPVPFQNKLFVHIRSMENENIILHVYDINGKELIRKGGTTNSLIELETGEMISGMYLVKAATTEGTVVQKVIKE